MLDFIKCIAASSVSIPALAASIQAASVEPGPAVSNLETRRMSWIKNGISHERTKTGEKKLVEVNYAIALYSREMTQTNEFFGGKGDRISKLTADLDQLRRNLPVEIAAGDKIKTENKALSVELDRACAELTPFKKLIRSYTAELEVAYLHKKRLCLKVATHSLVKELESEADEVISIRGKDIYNLTQDTTHLKDKVSELQSILESGIENFESQKSKIRQMKHDIECTQENIAQTRIEKETGDSHMQMLVEWFQDENERRDRLLDIQAELEDYCEKTVSKSDDGGGGCSDEVMMLARCGGLDGGDESAVMAAVVRGGVEMMMYGVRVLIEVMAWRR
uniref:Uncharacterized protein n=1 Tax=Tanacetum cinerariifolium TaxID=118510 RepID=A0A6L2M5B8_TANCI|nr:hypothetical protein [Tanacetum cinerariifolium]